MNMRTLLIQNASRQPLTLLNVEDISSASILGLNINILFRNGVEKTYNYETLKDAQNMLDEIYRLRTK